MSKPNELKLSGFAPAVLEGVVKAAGVICKAFGGKATSLIPVTGGDVAAMFGIGGITDPSIRCASLIVMPMRDSSYPEALCSDALRA